MRRNWVWAGMCGVAAILKWTFDDSRVAPDSNPPPSLFTAIQEELGLKLEATKAVTDVLVLDAVKQPSAN